MIAKLEWTLSNTLLNKDQIQTSPPHPPKNRLRMDSNLSHRESLTAFHWRQIFAQDSVAVVLVLLLLLLLSTVAAATAAAAAAAAVVVVVKVTNIV